MSRTPTLPEMLNRTRDLAAADIRVSLPGVITRWDPSTQLADVQPQISDRVENDDGSITDVQLPVIPNCPVQFPGAGGMRLTFPVAVGDTCLIVFADRAVDTWQAQGGQQAPIDMRRHNLTDAFVLLGYHPNNKAWTGVDAGAITLGKDGSSADFVALAQKVLDQLNNMASAFNNHTHVLTIAVAAQSGSGGTGTGSAAPPVAQMNPASVASGAVKING
jgi:hypothetical protein